MSGIDSWPCLECLIQCFDCSSEKYLSFRLSSEIYMLRARSRGWATCTCPAQSACPTRAWVVCHTFIDQNNSCHTLALAMWTCCTHSMSYQGEFGVIHLSSIVCLLHCSYLNQMRIKKIPARHWQALF